MPWPRQVREGRGAGLPAVFWWLWSGALVNSLASFLIAFLALFLVSRGFSVERAGLVVALFGAGSAAAGPLAGAAADRIGRRPTILFALCASASITALLGGLSSQPAIAAAVLLLGLIATSYRPAASAVIADIVPQADRARAFGHLYWAANLGMAVSATVGGFLAARGWGTLFLVDAGTTFLFALVVWRRIPESRPAAPAGGAAAPARGYGAVLSDRVFLAFLGLQFSAMLAFLQFLVALPVDMGRHGFDPATYGRVIAVNGVLIVALQPFATPLLARLDSSRVLALGSTLVGLGYGGYALCSAAWHWAAATAVWTLGEICLLPMAATVVAALAPSDLRGRYQGLYGFTWGAAMFVSPALGSALLGRLGARSLWAACLGISLLVALGHLAAGGARRRRLEARPGVPPHSPR